MESPKNFNKLLLEFGTSKAIAIDLDVSIQSVYLWAKLDKVPTRYLKKIEELSEGRIKPVDLRPELALPNFNKPGVTFDQTNVNAEEQEPIIQPTKE